MGFRRDKLSAKRNEVTEKSASDKAESSEIAKREYYKFASDTVNEPLSKLFSGIPPPYRNHYLREVAIQAMRAMQWHKYGLMLCVFDISI